MPLTGAQQTFVDTWSPYAASAGAALNLNPSLVLSQWAFESGWGSNSLSASYNVGAIKTGGPGGGSFAQYSSPGDFTQAYVSLMQRNYSNALGAQTASDFVNGLQNGRIGSYFGNDNAAAYLAGIENISARIGGVDAVPASLPTSNASGTGSGSSSGSATNSSGCGFDPRCWLSALGDWFKSGATRMGFVALGLVLLVGAFLVYRRDG